MKAQHPGNIQAKLPRLSIAALLLFFYGIPALHAQTTGTIYGTVTDPSGAAIVAAKVTAENGQTGLIRSSITSANGAYTIPLLPIGNYELSVEAPGFEIFRQSGLILQVEQQMLVNVKMQVGQVTQRVTVTAAPPQVNTSSATLGKVVEERSIVNLPLNGRNFLQLGVLQPGVVPPVAGILSQGSGTNHTPGGTSVDFVVNGLRPTSNNYLLDGVNNVEPFTGTAMIVPSVDAIQEFRILTNMYSAEFGRGGGSIVTILTKSGTNAFHGSAYDFLRNDIFDARNIFAPSVPKLTQNQFGGTVGGPVLKNRTFFFASYEGFRQRHGEPISTPVPSLAERSGNFNQDAVKPINPATQQPFPNNQVPVNPVAANVLKLYPQPNLGSNIWTGTPELSADRDQLDVRIDHALIRGRNNLTGRYILDQGSYDEPGGSSILNLGIVNVPGFGLQSPNRFQNLEVGDTNIFSSRLLNEFRFSYQRSRVTNELPTNNTSPAALGFTYPIDSSVPAPPGIAVSGFSALGYNFFNNYLLNLYQYSDNVTVTRGNHSFKFGGDAVHTDIGGIFSSIAFGSFGFTGAVTHNPVADLVLGAPTEFLQAGGKDNKGVSQTAYSLYAEDDYRAFRKLTLNLGVRWEVSPGFTDPENLEMTFVPGEQSVQSPTLPLGLLRPGDPGIPQTIFPTSHHDFAPRIGLAWDPSGQGKTSIRAGYGIFYDDSSLLQIALVQQPPDFQPINVLILPKSFANPYSPGTSPFTPPLSFPLKFVPGFTATWVSQDFKLPYVQQWNFTVQHQFTSTLAVELGYVGDKGTRLQGTYDPNQAVWMPGASRTNVQSRRPYPLIGNVLDIASRFASTYNGLQANVTKRVGNGLTFQGSYTFSRAIDNDSAPTGFYTIPGQQTRPQNSRDLAAEKGLSAFDIRHRFVGSYVYALPFYTSRQGLRAAALGGWRLSGIVTTETGRPFTVYDSADPNAGTLVDNTRPNVLSNPNLPRGQQTPQRWFNTAAFQRITPGTWGNEGRNTLFTAGIIDFDMGLAKDFRLLRENDLEFRWEVFNIFNHPDFAAPINDFNSPSFGRVLSTTVPEKQMQFALKFLF